MDPDELIRESTDRWPDPGPRRRNRRLAAGFVVLAAVALVATFLLTRSAGPPTAPVGVRVIAKTCGDPCERLEPTVTLTWAPPSGGTPPTSYRIIRDGVPLEAELGADDLRFVDATVTIGQRYGYQVIAQGDEGSSAPTTAIETTVPTPPEDAAHLDGVYRVRLTVRSARSIGAAFGIDNPLPGKRDRDRWSFESTCSNDEGACPSVWTDLEGAIEPRGTRWRGTVAGLPARCGRNDRVPAPIRIDLTAIDVAVADGAWVVAGFRGTASVAFRCPGFPAASATVTVTGVR
jgi:hypothetical protein